jgi:mannosyltransferase
MKSDSAVHPRPQAGAEVAARPTAEGTSAVFVIRRRLLLCVLIPAIVAVNVLNAVALFLYHHRHHHGGRFFRMFSLDKEANVPSWFSSTLLLTAAAVVALIALALARKAPWRRHWAGLSLVFVVLSLDETAEIHERIGSWLRANLDLHGPLHYAGVIPALALALFVGITYVGFLRALPRVTRLGILLAAAVYISGAAGVEALSGWWADRHGSGSTALLLASTVEENLEMIGTTLFILVVLSYFARFGRPVTLGGETARFGPGRPVTLDEETARFAAARLRLECWFGAATAAAVASGFGLLHLGSRSLWGDEAFSVTLAGEPLSEFWRVVAHSQANMSLYYVLLREWTRLGDSEAVVRLLSLLTGVLAVLFLYAGATRLFNRRVATVAALLLAVNGFFLRYAQEARSYSLVLLLTTAATLAFLALEERPDARWLGVAYAVVGALALYAHFFAAFVLCGHAIALAVAGRPVRAQLLRLAFIGVLALPLALFTIFRDAGQVSHLTRPTPKYIVDTLQQLAGGTRPLLALYAAAVVVAGATWLRSRDRRSQWAMVNAAVWATTPIVGAIVVSLGKPLFAPRFLIVALPGIALLVAIGLERLPLPLTVAGFAVVFALSALHVVRTQGKPQEDFRAATAYMLANDRPGDAVVFYRTSRRIPFEYYARRRGSGPLPKSLLPTSPYSRFDLVDDYRHTHVTDSELVAIREAASRGRVWLFLSRSENERAPEKRENRARVVAAVEEAAHQQRRRLFAGLDIRLYEPSRKAD